MLFLKKHGWWLLVIVVGLGISVLILYFTEPPSAVDEVEQSTAVQSTQVQQSNRFMRGSSSDAVVTIPPPKINRVRSHTKSHQLHAQKNIESVLPFSCEILPKRPLYQQIFRCV